MCITSVTWSNVTSFSWDWCKEDLRQSEPSLASVNSFFYLMSNPLAFDFLLPLMTWDALASVALFVVLAFLCVCPYPFLPRSISALIPWKDLLSLCLFFYDLVMSPIACFLTYLKVFCNVIICGLLQTPSFHSVSFPTKGKRPHHGLGLAGPNVDGKRILGMEVSSASSEDREIWLKKAKNWKLGSNGKRKKSP